LHKCDNEDLFLSLPWARALQHIKEVENTVAEKIQKIGKYKQKYYLKLTESTF